MHIPITIAIDGYSSCGKSSLAKDLARELKFVYIDSGAMYRAVTYFFLKNKIDWNKPELVEKALENIEIEIKFKPEKKLQETYLNGKNIEQKIREMEVSNHVSEVSTLDVVRNKMVQFQREMRNRKGIVMDGRDIGTVVFPDAELKIFMTATLEVRVERRWKELKERGLDYSKEEVKENLKQRDHTDVSRVHSPLRKAEDARELDNTNLTKEQQLRIAIKWAHDAMLES